MELTPGLCTALTPATVEKLRVASIRNAADFVAKDTEQLSLRLQLPYKDLCSIRRVLLAEFAVYPLSAASLYQNALTTQAALSTGFESLDSLLDGGLYTGEMTELAGDSAAGKTLICHTASAAVVATDHTSVLYVDTSCGLSSRFMLDCLLKIVGENSSEESLQLHLNKIRCVQAFDTGELIAALENLASNLTKKTKDTSDLKLVIVDSLANIIYPETSGGFQYSQGLLSQIGHRLKHLAVTFSLAVVVTNSLVSAGVGRKAALGKLWSHSPHTRIVLDRCDNPVKITCARTAHLVKSCRQKTPCSTEFSLER